LASIGIDIGKEVFHIVGFAVEPAGEKRKSSAHYKNDVIDPQQTRLRAVTDSMTKKTF
jgi:hypothetical protein